LTPSTLPHQKLVGRSADGIESNYVLTNGTKFLASIWLRYIDASNIAVAHNTTAKKMIGVFINLNKNNIFVYIYPQIYNPRFSTFQKVDFK